MIIYSGVKRAVSGTSGGAHVLVLHRGEFLEFILSVVNVDLEYTVGLLLDFFFPLGSVRG